MSRTRTKYVNFQTLQERGSSANTVIKLMMASNDLFLANQSLADWKKDLPGNTKSKQVGAKLYFLRLQMAHLYEGLNVIEEIKNNSSLEALICRCDAQTQKCYKEIEQFLPKAQKRKQFEQLVGRVRNNLTFHYDENGKSIEKAVSDRAERAEARISSVTQGDALHLCHFKVADDVVDSIITRQIWNISREVDAQIEADKIADFVFQIAMWFLDFSSVFIWEYLEN